MADFTAFTMKEDTMSPKYRVTLTSEEHKELEAMTRRGKTLARRFIHARALLCVTPVRMVRHGMLPMLQEHSERPAGRLST